MEKNSWVKQTMCAVRNAVKSIRGTALKADGWIRARLTRDRLVRLVGYMGLIALLTALGLASHAYRHRGTAWVEATATPAPAMAVTTPEPSPEPTAAPQVFVWPVEGEIIRECAIDEPIWSSAMGQWQTHPAIDIRSAAGEAVVACADGVVSDAWQDPVWGNVITIEHPDGGVSTYANLNTLNLVNVGESVSAGQVISAVGNSAACESDLPWHVHFSYAVDGNPVNYFNFMAGFAP